MLRKWLDGPGGGGPTYYGPGRPGAGQMRDALGHLDRRLMLDRTDHTQNCSACRQVSTTLLSDLGRHLMLDKRLNTHDYQLPPGGRCCGLVVCSKCSGHAALHSLATGGQCRPVLIFATWHATDAAQAGPYPEYGAACRQVGAVLGW